MTLTTQTSLSVARTRAVVSLLVLIITALAATSASADPVASAPPPAATASAPPASDPAAPAAATDPSVPPSTPAPDPSAGGSLSVAPAPPASPAPAATPATPVPTYGDDIQPQPAVIAQGSAQAPIGRPTHDAPPPPAAHSGLDQPIVGTPHRATAAVYRPTVTQLASGGPFIAASGTAVTAAVSHPRRPAAAHRPTAPLVPGMPAAWQQVARTISLPVVAISVPLAGVFITSEPSARRPEAKTPPVVYEPIGPAGLVSTSLSPLGPGSLELPGAAMFGSAPFSSPGGSSAPLLGLNAMLAAMTVLAGIAWRRRSWDHPVLQGESALLSAALDRPG